jgi:hypothetical protein
MDTLLTTLEHGRCKAEIYETLLPGQFSVHYRNEKGDVLAEESLTGVSSYRQREDEIIARMEEFCKGMRPEAPELADPGEY